MSLANTLVRISTETHARLYQLLGGKGMGGNDDQGSVVVVTTTGRTSGKPRPKPLMHIRDGDDYVVAGSNNGGDDHPAWIHNMVANPDVTVQHLDQVIQCTATVEFEGPRRDELFRRFVDGNDRFGGYESKTDRTIPVAVLTPK